MIDVIVSESEAKRRHIARGDYVACRLAFIDCKKPGSHLKENYSIIGPGVTQSADQVINLAEPHGFNIGAAAMPHGIVNNPHIHYTAEVFLCFGGAWEFYWGNDGKDGTIVGSDGDIVSVPTWIFRGFRNVGPDDGWIFTVLGGDDTGGIIWHPEILRDAATHGLYLTRDNMLVDTTRGEAKPAPEQLMPPMTEADAAKLKRWSAEAMRTRIVAATERNWSEHALLCSVLPRHRVSHAPVIGWGMSEDRDAAPKIANPHGFSVEWLRIPAGASLPRHRVASKQVMLVRSGTLELAFNDIAQSVRQRVEKMATLSLPAGAWRMIENVGVDDAEIALITSGDAKQPIEWSREIVDAASAAGWGIDHNGYLAPYHLLPRALARSA